MHESCCNWIMGKESLIDFRCLLLIRNKLNGHSYSKQSIYNERVAEWEVEIY